MAVTHFGRRRIQDYFDGVDFNRKPSEKYVDNFLKKMEDDYIFVCTTEVTTKNSLEGEQLNNNKVSANR